MPSSRHVYSSQGQCRPMDWRLKWAMYTDDEGHVPKSRQALNNRVRILGMSISRLPIGLPATIRWQMAEACEAPRDRGHTRLCRLGWYPRAGVSRASSRHENGYNPVPRPRTTIEWSRNRYELPQDSSISIASAHKVWVKLKRH